MLMLMKVSLFAAAVATTSAAQPVVPPAQALMAFMPLAIIEGGTVSTLPKGARSHAGRVVVLRGRGDRAKLAPAKKKSPVEAPATAAASASESGRVAAARECQCAAGGVSGGGSSTEIVELRTPEVGLRVMILGPDGLTRTRYVPAPPGSAARYGQD